MNQERPSRSNGWAVLIYVALSGVEERRSVPFMRGLRAARHCSGGGESMEQSLQLGDGDKKMPFDLYRTASPQEAVLP